MRNKKICKICMNCHTDNGWNDMDERAWAAGISYCPCNCSVLKIEERPECCFYEVEHVVSDLGKESEDE